MKTGFLIKRRNTYWVTFILLLVCLMAILPGCASGESPPEEAAVTLALSSPAFQEGSSIPDRYTCQGADISPPLSWSAPPAGTRSLALIVEDLDTSGMFTHWVIFNIPAASRELAEALSSRSEMPGALGGKNDFGNTGYGGPCPPSGKAHRYQFMLYALDGSLGLEAGASKKEILQAMEGHILARGRLVGTYQR